MDTSPFNRSSQHQAKRAAILSQAAKLFNTRGSRATTLLDIADSLGLTKTSLYYYVKTKEELIYQCYMAALARHLKVMKEIQQQYSEPLQRCEAFFKRQFTDWLDAQEGKCEHVAALIEIDSLNEQHQKDVHEGYIKMFKYQRRFLQDGIADGSIRECETIFCTRAIFASMEWSFSWLHQVPRDEIPELADKAWDILLHGLANTKGVYPQEKLNYQVPESTNTQSFDREQQNKIKQEAFSKVGTRFFNTHGFGGTSLDKIAEHLNVTKGAFYYHIKNKEDLLFQCYTRSLGIIKKIHEKVATLGKTGLERIDYAVRYTFYIQNTDHGPLIRYSSVTSLPLERRLEVLKQTEEAYDGFAEFIQQGIDDGSVRPVNTTLAVHLITGAMNAAMSIERWRQVDDLDSAAIDYFDIFINGLSPKSSD